MIGEVALVGGQKVGVPLSGQVSTDEVTLDNMQSVSSNAVAEAGSYSTTEIFTGKYWTDGRKIYRKTYIFANITLPTTPTVIGTITDLVPMNVVKKEIIVKNSYMNAICSETQTDVYLVGTDLYARQTLTGYTTEWYVYYTVEYVKPL